MLEIRKLYTALNRLSKKDLGSIDVTHAISEIATTCLHRLTAFDKRILRTTIPNKEYFVDDDDGNVISPKGKKRKLVGSNGYLRFNVNYRENKVFPCSVHRLMAYQKFGDAIFEAGVVVRHLDGDSKNNSFCNIAIGTASDNMLDIPKDTGFSH